MLNQSLITSSRKSNDRDIAAAEVGVLLSQTAFGEQAILPGLRHLKGFFKTPAVLRLIDSHLRDEERHAKLYTDLSEQFLPGVTHKTPRVYRHIENLFTTSTNPTWLLAAMHLCLESFALGVFEYRARYVSDERIQFLDASTRADEERHVNFGPTLTALLSSEGTRCSKKDALAAIRQMHASFLEDSIASQVASAMAFAPNEYEINESALLTYRLLCTRSFERNLLPFLSSMRAV